MDPIPVFIPYVNRPDLLMRAVESVATRRVYEPIVIDNSPNHEVKDMPISVKIETPTQPLNFTKTQNYMVKLAQIMEVPYYFFMHSDAEDDKSVLSALNDLAFSNYVRGRRWGAIFTSYDALAAFNVNAMLDIGGWDEKIEWYSSDNDVYRRMRLANWSVVDSGLEVKHTPSQTLNSDPNIRRQVDLMFPYREAYYKDKWGGSPGHEKFSTPWGK